MKTFLQFLAPLGLGFVAFILVWVAVEPQLGHNFVIVTGAVAVDEPLKEAQLGTFKVVGEDFTRLNKTLVPWEERAAVIGLPARRALATGDFVFWQDLQYVLPDFSLADDEIPLHVSLEGVEYEPSLLKLGNLVGLIVPVVPPDDNKRPATPAAGLKLNFEELGPFRILSVGQRTLGSPTEASTSGARGSTHMVTFACRLDAASRDRSTGHAVPEAARKLLAAKLLKRVDGKNIVAMVLYQRAQPARP